MIYDNVLTEKFFYKNYVENKLSFPQIREKLLLDGIDIATSTLYNYAQKYDIRRTASEARKNWADDTTLDYSVSFLNESMIEAIDGFLLGDGGIAIYDGTNVKNGRLRCGVEHEEFCGYLMKFFEPYGGKIKQYDSKSMSSGLIWNGASLFHPDIYAQYLRWYPGNIKQPPEDVRITPTSVMMWYLGDGSLVQFESDNSIILRLSTDGFDKDKVIFLAEKLCSIGINCHRTNINRIYVESKGIPAFFNFIGKTSPVECYKYKFSLPEWRFETKRMSEVAKELGIPYNQLSYWVKHNLVPCLKTSLKSRPRFSTEHIEKIKEYAEYDKNTPKVEKIKKTNLERYGVENPFQNEEVKSKIKETMLERYGVDSPLKSEVIRERVKKTCVEKYGVDNPRKSEEIKEKSRNTCIEKYGVDNPQKSEEIKDRTRKSFDDTVLKDVGGRYKNINLLRDEDFWSRLPDYSLKNICKHFDVDYQSITALLLSPEFKDKYYSTYSFPKTQTQKEIKDILEKYNFKVEFNDRSVISPLELDIFLPEKKFAIEYNGNLWHSEYILDFKEAQNKHFIKTKLCRDKGVRLFHIFEHQWSERKDQILNFIKTILGLNTQKIMARKCSITNDVCKEFLEKNHIQGYGNRTIKFFNLVYDGEIVATLTASKHHRQNAGGNPIVLNRLCFKDGVSVQGGSSKLFKEFVFWAKNEGYDRILSWSDNCWTDGRIYEVLGFTLEKEYGPDYFLFNIRDHKVYSKQSQKKSATGCPKDIKEKDWNADRGFYRVWDSGLRLWQYKL